MVNWKIALVVIIIAALVIAIGVWLGYRYGSEQDDMEGLPHQRSNTSEPGFDRRFVLSQSFVETS